VTYDALVVGLGAMGSAALAHCAARGMRVAGFERFAPAHDRGSSHGRTRIIRQAYFEGAAYVPLLQRAYVLWDELERRSKRQLRAQTGGLFAGLPSCDVVAGTLASARAHGLAYAVYDAADMRRRYPQVRLHPDEVAVFEAVAGALFPERCVLAYLDAAVTAGAHAFFGVPVTAWEEAGGVVRITAGTAHYETRRLIVCAGAWFESIVAGLDVPLRVERNVQYWFAPRAPDAVRPERLPVFALERTELPYMLYGFADFGDGVKCAFHHSGQMVGDPDALEREVMRAEADAAHAALRGWLPAAAGPLRAAVACMYTLTPDEHFVIGVHPAHERVIVAGGFSGHGFKFASVVGEIVADLAESGGTAHDIAQFAPGRFAKASAP
jgi:sarcosine oxidase